MPSYIRWFQDFRLADLALVGGKNASLGELTRALGLSGIRVPATPVMLNVGNPGEAFRLAALPSSGALEDFLRQTEAKFQLVTHRGGVTAQEQAAVMHTSGWATAKVVIVKERDGRAMAVLAAACVLDLGRLKGLIGHGEVRLATVEEIARATPGCAPGAIPPFGSLFGMPTFADTRLLAGRDITMPAGDFGTAIRMRAKEYQRLARPRVGDFAVPESLVTRGAAWHERRPRRRAS